MSESLRMWVEISFNIAYLVGVFVLIVAMIRRQPTVATEDQPLTRRFIWAFVLLASGDVEHVGLRVLAYAMGELGTVGQSLRAVRRPRRAGCAVNCNHGDALLCPDADSLAPTVR